MIHNQKPQKKACHARYCPPDLSSLMRCSISALLERTGIALRSSSSMPSIAPLTSFLPSSRTTPLFEQGLSGKSDYTTRTRFQALECPVGLTEVMVAGAHVRLDKGIPGFSFRSHGRPSIALPVVQCPEIS